MNDSNDKKEPEERMSWWGYIVVVLVILFVTLPFLALIFDVYFSD